MPSPLKFTIITLSGISFGWLVGLFVISEMNFAQADRLVVEPTPTPAPSTSVKVLPAPTYSPPPKKVAGQASVRLSLYDVTLTVAEPITDLVYGEVKYNGRTIPGFTTERLLAKYTSCKAGALGTLVRTPAKSASPSPSRSVRPSTRVDPNAPFTKTVGAYTYTYQRPSFTCVTDQDGRNDIAAAIAALKNQALPTITP
ncbi:MAG: hypothetical protein K0S68_787 [Candidatus Saccharibacteria bacterium]|jgi:hypothetical protein|nr:hypothetical protein [Candidatus Saccharibacteria bacterium]